MQNYQQGSHILHHELFVLLLTNQPPCQQRRDIFLQRDQEREFAVTDLEYYEPTLMNLLE